MAGFLQAIGQGQPIKAFGESYKGITDVLEAPQNRALKIEGMQQERAIRQETLIGLQRENKATQEAKARADAPMNIRSIAKQMGIMPEGEEAFVNFSQMYGVDQTGLGRTEDVHKAFGEFLKSPQGVAAINGQVNYLNQVYENDETAYQNATKKGMGIEKITELKTKRDQSLQELNKWGGVKLELSKRLRNRDSLLGELNQLQNEGTLKDLPPMVVSSLRSSAEEGDRESWDKLQLEFAKAKQITPHWETVKDSKSPTGWSRQDMNNPTAPLRTGAPAPTSEKSTGQNLKIPKLNVVRDMLNEDYANMIGIDKNDVNKRLSPVQKKAYNEIIGLAEKNASTMEPRAALDKALTDWHKKNPPQKAKGQTEEKTKTLTENQAKDFLKRAGGDKDKARKLAKQEGYTF